MPSRTDRVRRRALLAGAVALVLVLTGCDWSQVGFGPQHTFHNPSEAAFTDTSLANLTSPWSRTCLTCRSSLVSGNTLYFVGLDSLHAIDTATGHQLWEVPLGSDYVLRAVGNGLVYLLHQPSSGSHQLVARSATDGSLRFTFTPLAQPGDSATISDMLVDGTLADFVATTVHAGQTTSSVYAVDPTGKVTWARTPDGQGSLLVAEPGKAVYVGSLLPGTPGQQPFGQAVLTTYKPSDGTVLARVLPKVASGATPPIATLNGLVYAFDSGAHGGGGAGLSAIDPTTGNVAWGSTIFPEIVTPSVVVTNDAVEWVGQNPTTGATLWGHFPGTATARAVAMGNYVLRPNGASLVVHRLSDFSVVTTLTPAANENILDVAVASGRIFVTTTAHLVALKPPAS